MSENNSQLLTNLQTIYNTKLQIKAAIGTNSDDFTEYPTLISEALENGEGGGSGSSVDNPFTALTLGECLYGEDQVTSGGVISIRINSNFISYLEGEPIEESGQEVDQIEFDTIAYEEGDQEEIEHPVHVILTQGEGNYGLGVLNDIYFDNEDHIADIMEQEYFVITCRSWSATEAQEGEDYEWIVECESLDYINLMENTAPVEEITENGLYMNDGQMGFYVNVEGEGSSEPNDFFNNPIWIQDAYEEMDSEGVSEKHYDFVKFPITSNFVKGVTNGVGVVDVMWDCEVELDQYTTKTVHIYISTSEDPYNILNEAESFELNNSYGVDNVSPILQDVTITELTNSPSGYDYVVSGELHSWNLQDVGQSSGSGSGSGSGSNVRDKIVFIPTNHDGGNATKIILQGDESDILLLEPINWTDWQTGGLPTTYPYWNCEVRYNGSTVGTCDGGYYDLYANTEYYNIYSTRQNQSITNIDSIIVTRWEASTEPDPDTGDPIVNWTDTEQYTIPFEGNVQGNELWLLMAPGFRFDDPAWSAHLYVDGRPVAYWDSDSEKVTYVGAWENNGNN